MPQALPTAVQIAALMTTVMNHIWSILVVVAVIFAIQLPLVKAVAGVTTFNDVCCMLTKAASYN